YVAITGDIIKLDDAYSIPDSEEYSFNKSYDENTGYRTKSMLTVPMKNHKDKIIGVIQLINKKKDKSIVLSGHDIVEDSVIPFDHTDEEIVLSLSSLAAVSLDNNQLYHEIEDLFECLVMASAKAIEQRDPATSGHSSRVAKYTVMLAEAVSADKGFFKDITFTADHLKGLRYACLLHDFGKVGVRENVLVKAKKLYPGMLEQILLRFDNIRNNIKIKYLEAKLALDTSDPGYNAKLEELILNENIETVKIEKYRDTVIAANEPAVLDSDPGKILSEIKKEKNNAFLSKTEYEYLSVKRGSLTQKEREEIMSHAKHTYDFLKNIPWPENMAWIPEIAKGHHESLDGSGYPDGIKGDSIPFESRLMAVSDVFDALTASDRPYKRSVPVEKAVAIIRDEAASGKLDREVVKLFIESGIYKAASSFLGSDSLS
ncbi:MAG: HD domain-containing phosphohydrolase, partial [Spirochaetia bacterium]|nr:HD domain-containing phosphohydrolase [Spirochaetia bacterium]